MKCSSNDMIQMYGGHSVLTTIYARYCLCSLLSMLTTIYARYCSAFMHTALLHLLPIHHDGDKLLLRYLPIAVHVKLVDHRLPDVSFEAI